MVNLSTTPIRDLKMEIPACAGITLVDGNGSLAEVMLAEQPAYTKFTRLSWLTMAVTW